MNDRSIKLHIFRTLMLFSLFLFSATSAFSYSYNAGFTKYQRGDFKGAERSLLQALSKEMPEETRASTYKILGICQYKLGNKNGATKSFKAAIALAADISIDASEVIDPTVIDHFKKAKKEYVAANPPPAPVAPTSAAVTVAPAATVPVPPVPSVDMAAGSGSGMAVSTGSLGKKKGGTFIIVESTNPDANVMIDGIRAGPVNSQIEVDPGSVTVEISALGMETKTQTIEAVKGQITTVAVELVKPKKILAKKKQKKRNKKRKQENDMFDAGSKKAGYNPAAEFESDTGLSPYAPAPATAYQPGAPTAGYAPQVAANNGGQYTNNYQVSTAATHGNYFIAALPFGAGQFQNRSVFTGIVFFGGEVGALYYYYSKSKSAKNSETSIEAFKAEKAAEGGEMNEDDKIFVEESETYIAGLKKKSTYGLYGFGALWLVGVVEAIVNDPLSAAAKQAPVRGPRPGRYGEIRENENTRLLSHGERHYEKEWAFHLLPEDNNQSGSFSSQAGMKLLWELNF